MPDVGQAMGQAMSLSALAKQNKLTDKRIEAQDLAMQEAELNKKLEHASRAASLAISATDEASYQKMRGVIRGMGIDDSNLPQNFDPGLMKQYATISMNARDRYAAQMQELQAKRADRQLDINSKLARQKSALEYQKGNMKLAADLRKERSGLPTSKASQDVSAAYNKVQSAASNPSAAGDLSMIFNYMKMLDPGSVVREGEFATAQNAAGVPTRVQNQYNQLLKGERLSPTQRKDFSGQARNLYKAQLSQQEKIDADFRRLAEKHGIDPKDIILNFGADDAQNQSAGSSLSGGGSFGVSEAVAADSPPPPHGQTVIQNGVSYEWNPQTGKYE